MGLLKELVLLPLAPVRGVVWIAAQLQEVAEREMNDPAALRRRLSDAEAELAAGRITPEEYEALEEAIVERLLELQRPSPSGGGR